MGPGKEGTVMELLVLVAALIVLDVLAVCYGADSRPGLTAGDRWRRRSDR